MCSSDISRLQRFRSASLLRNGPDPWQGLCLAAFSELRPSLSSAREHSPL